MANTESIGLKEIERFYDDLPQPVWVADESGEIVYASRLLYDYAGSQIIIAGTRWHDLIFHEDVERTVEIWADARDKHIDYRLKFRLRSETGEYRWFKCAGNESAQVLEGRSIWLGLLTDIHNETVLSEQLIEQKELLSTIIEQLPVAVGVTSRVESEYLLTNERMRDIFNHPDWPPADWPLDKAMRENRAVHHEMVNHKNVLGVSCSPVRDKTGKVVAGVVVCESLQEKINLERAKLEAESAAKEAQASANFKSSFVANMSHDLRTPISAISGLASLLLTGGQLSEESREQVETIAECGKTLVNLVNDVLDLAKLEAGKLEFDTVEFSLRAAQDAVIRMARAYASGAKKKIKLTARAENLPPYVKGDPRRFEQILINLVTNAIKFTPNGGEVTVGFVTKEQVESGKILVCSSVKDNGIGIPSDMQGKLFTPFSQVGGATRGASLGSGLGLSICKNLVTSMGGTIRVISQTEDGPDKGSEFSFEIPFQRIGKFDPNRENQPTEALKVLSRDDRAKQLILLAEDNPLSANIARKMLSRHGYGNVTWVKNGQEAVDAMAVEKKTEPRGPLQNTAPFDVILMDCQMPVLNGFQATREIRKVAPGVPIVALTASAHQDDTDMCITSGMDFIVLKPFDPENLVRLIDNLLAP